MAVLDSVMSETALRRKAMPVKDKPQLVVKDVDRIHYLDNLRAIAMLLGVFLHAALAYADPTQIIWLATDPRSSRVVDALFCFIHLFRMSLFFVIAGYFAKRVVESKGIRGFLWNRLIRIVCPFVLFYPFLTGLFLLLVIFATAYLTDPQGLIGEIVRQTRAGTVSTEGRNWTTMHLWFLYYLMLFAGLTVCLSRWRPISFDWVIRRRWLWGFLPLVLAPGVLLGGIGLPAPESFLPQVWPFLFYGIFYWAGWRFYGNEGALTSLKPLTWKLATIGLVAFIPYYLLLPKIDATVFETQTAPTVSPVVTVIEGVLTAYLATILTLLAFLLGQKYLDRRQLLMRFLSDASYWIYLTHLPVVQFLQTLLIEAPIGLVSKLILVTGGAFVFCMATYFVFVRYTPIGWLLNGKRSFP